MPRTPVEIMTDFDAGAQGRADIDMRGALWEVIEDIFDSFRGAMTSAQIGAMTRRSIMETVRDYAVTHYGDDST